MKHWLISLFFIIIIPALSGSQENPYWQEPTLTQSDSLKKVLAGTKSDTVKMYVHRQLGIYYQEMNRPVALVHFNEQLKIAKDLNQKIWEAEALSRIGYVHSLQYNFPGGLKAVLEAKQIASQNKAEQNLLNIKLFSKDGDPHIGRLTLLASIEQHLGLLYHFSGNYKKAREVFAEVNRINKESLLDVALFSMTYLCIGEAFYNSNQLDSAKFYLRESLEYCSKSGYEKYKGLTYCDLGGVYELEGNYEEARKYYLLSIPLSTRHESTDYVGLAYIQLAILTRKANEFDSSFIYARKAIDLYINMNDTVGMISSYQRLSETFDGVQKKDSAYYYLKKSLDLASLMNKEEKVKSFQAIGFDEQIKLQALEAERLLTKSRIRTWTMIAGILVLLLVSGMLLRHSRQQKKNRIRTEKAYDDLKATQQQLIQSEKMASLGELTAGIAHEIQNPLNFVNNFSEVNNELIEELRSRKSKIEREEQDEILNDIFLNNEKISHHGKRADAIVKGMLQHSRTSTGQKEPTDINALVDEYLRLAYHGLRAKDKSFNAELRTDFDNSIGKLNIIPQDIGRVVLNLINNAFYAVDEKKKHGSTNSAQNGFEPTVLVSTKKNNGNIEIRVSDNGNGIPEKVLDKIFQPFFTTKPTGQGTGLGLSLSYDIVKAHGGEIKVESKEGEGSLFSLCLNIK